MTKYKYSEEQITEAVKESVSVAEVMRRLGMRLAGGSHAHIAKRIKKLGLDTKHFLGKGSNRGETKKGGPDKIHWSLILVIDRQNGRRESASKLRRALIEYGRKYICDWCGQLPEWCGLPLVLEIDHINGNFLDNRPENLVFLCPHCHSQKTFNVRSTHG